MKSRILTLFLLCCTVHSLNGQNINGRISLGAYGFERFDSVGSSQSVIHGAQSLYLNINQQKFSLRTSLSYESFSKSSLGVDRLRLYTFHLEGRKLWDVLSFKLGRHSIFNGPATGLYDGISLKGTYSDFEANFHYGGVLPSYQKMKIAENFSDNSVTAASLSYNYGGLLGVKAGYSAKNLKRPDYSVTRLDDQFNPITLLIKQNSNQFRYIFLDADYSPENMFAGLKTEYDLNISKLSKLEVQSDFELSDALDAEAYLLYREPTVTYNSIFSVFDYGNTFEGEVGLGYKFLPGFRLGANFAYINYKDDNSHRYGFSLTTDYGSLSYRGNGGYAGEMQSVSLYVAKTFFEGMVTPSLGLAYTDYKLSADAETNNLTTLLGGVNVRPLKSLSFDLQMQYMNNKIYSNDLRLLIKANYWFNTNLGVL
ncbi:MAG: hypothetical protein FMNOHCHN_01257 [Ignavibacteriaceae bacterium]|nr:hypothetical protein [Ignavibacteriaceae bacterium]